VPWQGNFTNVHDWIGDNAVILQTPSLILGLAAISPVARGGAACGYDTIEGNNNPFPLPEVSASSMVDGKPSVTRDRSSIFRVWDDLKLRI
jgi:hypothetical protein